MIEKAMKDGTLEEAWGTKEDVHGWCYEVK